MRTDLRTHMARRDAAAEDEDRMTGGDAFAVNVSMEAEADSDDSRDTDMDSPAKQSPARLPKKDDAELMIVHQVHAVCACTVLLDWHGRVRVRIRRA